MVNKMLYTLVNSGRRNELSSFVSFPRWIFHFLLQGHWCLWNDFLAFVQSIKAAAGFGASTKTCLAPALHRGVCTGLSQNPWFLPHLDTPRVLAFFVCVRAASEAGNSGWWILPVSTSGKHNREQLWSCEGIISSLTKTIKLLSLNSQPLIHTKLTFHTVWHPSLRLHGLGSLWAE